MRTGVLHAVVLRAGSSLVASILSIKSRDYLSVGVFAHSPYLASASPGKFGMLFLARAALGEGYRFIDLTPGGEWKERFANDSDVAHEVAVRFDPNAARKAAWGERILAVSKKALKLFGLTPDMMRSSVAMVRRATPAAIIRHIMRVIWNRCEYRVYYYDVEKAAALEPERAMRRDCIDDLLRFEATTPWHTRQSFLAGALKRLESGVHAYTSCEDGRLNHCGWLAQNVEKSYFSEVGAEYIYPPNSVVLFDYHTHPEARGRGLYQRAILQMLKDAASVPEARRVYISVLADNGPSRHVIEKLGFDHECSLHRWVRFGQVTHSRTQALDCGSVTTDARTLR